MSCRSVMLSSRRTTSWLRRTRSWSVTTSALRRSRSWRKAYRWMGGRGGGHRGMFCSATSWRIAGPVTRVGCVGAGGRGCKAAHAAVMAALKWGMTRAGVRGKRVCSGKGAREGGRLQWPVSGRVTTSGLRGSLSWRRASREGGAGACSAFGSSWLSAKAVPNLPIYRMWAREEGGARKQQSRQP